MNETERTVAMRLWDAIWAAMSVEEAKHKDAGQSHIKMGRVDEALAALSNWRVVLAVKEAALEAARKELGIV